MMKKKMWLSGIAMLLTAALAGCGKGNEADQNISVKDYVYSVENFELEGGGNGRSNYSLLQGGDRIYVYNYQYNEDGTGYVNLKLLTEDGKAIETGNIEIEQNASLNSLKADGQGNIFGIKSIYQTEPDEDGMYREKYYLMKLTEKGEEQYSVCLNEMPELSELMNSNDYVFVRDLLLKDDFIYVNIMDSIVILDKDGKFQKIIKAAEGSGISYDSVSLYLLEDGKVAALSYEETGSYVSYADLENGTFTDKKKIPGVSYEYSVYRGIGYDLFMVNSYGVFGYNVGDEDKTQLMSYVDSDLGIYNIYNLIPLNEKQFLGVYDDMESNGAMVGKFTKVDPKDVKEKEIITLACTGLSWDIRTNVVKFNKTNENYRISIQDYSSLYGEEGDYMAGINRLNADIVSGRIPDIILVDNNMPIDSYISKGLIEDIKPYIERDAELDINNYMPNIIEAFSVDGKLYSLTPCYMINTIVAKTSDVGEERGWTIQDVKDLLATKPEGTMFLIQMSRESMLNYCMSVAGNQFVDWKAGTCNFDSDGFIQFLEFLNEFPEEIDEAVYDETFWQNYDSVWREGRAIAQIASISDFRSFNYMEKGTFGEPITMIGFPSMNGDGSSIMANMQFAMSAKSSKKEGAWEFMRYFLTDEYQENLNYGLPLSIKRLDELEEEAMKKPTYTDEAGNVIEQDETYYLNGVEIPISPMTQEEADRFKKELYSFTQVYHYDENLMQIIKEEAGAYFSGQKSAKDVAEIIQRRVQIYVNENR